MNRHYKLKTIFIIIIILSFDMFSQGTSSISLNRGRLWHSFYFAQECDPLFDWNRKSYGLDWPGYATSEIGINIGGSNSYLIAGGFYITALTDTGSVWGWDDFALNSDGNVGWTGDFNRYLVNKHEKRWPNGSNYWLATDPYEAEEIIETEWEWNGSWSQPWENQNIPIKVTRTVRQWSGSQADEDYLIIEFKIKNIRGLPRRPKEINGVYLLFTYAISPNHRGWKLLFPNLSEGARNTVSAYDPAKRLLTAWAGDYKDTPNIDESFDFYEYTRYSAIDDKYYKEPEYIAPAKMGIKFLYISPDSTGQSNRINKFVWSSALPANEHQGPLLGVAGLPAKYEAMANPDLLSSAFSDPSDQRMGRNRLYANFSLGPFNMQPEDSISVVIGEFVGGLTYEKAIDPSTSKQDIIAATDSAVNYLDERLQFNFAHNFQVPVPPPAPNYKISPVDTPGVIANLVSFTDSVESIPDPQQGIVDIAGYRIYRSWNYTFGPWSLVADFSIKDPKYYDSTTGTYRYIDYDVGLGQSYYYSLTSYDTGHLSWAIDNSVVVPSLESSIFANRKKNEFSTTVLPSKTNLNNVQVIPNPFYRSSGLEQLEASSTIQFTNLTENCILRIFTLRGDLVKTIYHNDPNNATIFWDQVSDNGQLVKSGMYFYHIENNHGEKKLGKFAIVK